MRKLLFILFVLSVGFISCDESESTDTSGIVKYVVNSAPAGFDITYQNSTGNTAQETVNASSWTESFTAERGDFVYISAQADNENATVTVEIYFKGQLIEEATSTGDFVIATASGSVP